MANPLTTPMCVAEATQWDVVEFLIRPAIAPPVSITIAHLDAAGKELRRQTITATLADIQFNVAGTVAFLRSRGVIN